MRYFIDLILFGCIYIIIYTKFWKDKKEEEILKYTIMYLYIVSVLFVTLIPIDFTLDPKWKYHHSVKVTYIHIKPFNDLIMGYSGAKKQIILNIMMTIPFGFLYSCIKKKVSFLKVIFMTFVLSLTIELLQLLTTIFLRYHRSSDVTDLITNIIGGAIGYIIYKVLYKR